MAERKHLYLRTVGGKTFNLVGYGDLESVDLWALISRAQRNHEELAIDARVSPNWLQINRYHLNPDNVDYWWVE